MKRVLWLASWYPGKTDPFNGDFVQRHARAVSQIQDLDLIFVTKDKALRAGKIIYETHEGPQLREYYAYYPGGKNNIGRQSISSLFYYFRAHRHLIRELIRNKGLPELVHVHIAMKAGLIALLLKWRYGIPYVITEHWTGYYIANPDNLKGKNIFYRFLVRLIFRNASLFLPVTEEMGLQVNHTVCSIPFRVIPNVVDTRLFQPQLQPALPKFRFIHISTMGYQKNPEGIIRCLKALLDEGYEASLTLIGPISESLRSHIARTGLPAGSIELTGEIKYEEVAGIMKRCHALLLFSRYENLPCVLLEALCCGLPVIATRVGGIAGVIDEQNGLLVDSENEHQMQKAMKTMIANYSLYNRTAISEKARDQFSYATVSSRFREAYHLVSGNSL